MNPLLKCIGPLAAAALVSAACQKQTTTTSAAKELERAFQVSPQPAAAEAPAPTPGQEATPRRPEVKQAVAGAVAAIRTNGYFEAFTTLRAIQASPTLTLNQYSAVESARLAVEQDMAAKAAAGDPAALRALESMKKAGH